MNNETLAVNALRYYFDNQKRTIVDVTNYSMFLNYYRKNFPTFMDAIGAAIGSVPQNKVKAAFMELASEYENKSVFPSTSEFFNKLSKYGGSVTLGDVGKVAADTIVDAGNFSGRFMKWGLIGGAVLLAVIVFLRYGKR